MTKTNDISIRSRRLIKQQFGLELTLITPEEGAGSGPLGSLWHPDCLLYKVVDTENSQTLGHCYLDPYIRDDKAYQVVRDTITGNVKID